MAELTERQLAKTSAQNTAPFRGDQTIKKENPLAEGVTTKNSGVAKAVAAQGGELQKPNEDDREEGSGQREYGDKYPDRKVDTTNNFENPNSLNTDSDDEQEIEDNAGTSESKKPEKRNRKWTWFRILFYLVNTFIWGSGLVFTSLGFFLMGGIVTSPIGIIFLIIGLLLTTIAFGGNTIYFFTKIFKFIKRRARKK